MGPKLTPSQNAFANISILRLMKWFHNNATSKTINDLDELVHEVILAPDFTSLASEDHEKQNSLTNIVRNPIHPLLALMIGLKLPSKSLFFVINFDMIQNTMLPSLKFKVSSIVISLKSLRLPTMRQPLNSST